MKVLILGGTTEASALCRALAAEDGFAPVLSLAGRTRAPVLPAGVPVRRGGFGGAAGLAAWLQAERVAALVDATHPFARRMHGNAAEAAAMAGVDRLCVLRPEWRAVAGDRWTEVDDMADAVAALGGIAGGIAGGGPCRVLLTVGQQELAPFRASPHDHLIRSVEPPDQANLPPRCRLIEARGPFTVAGELALLRDERIEAVVTKNSGGTAVAAKLEAARLLGLPVVLVRRPPLPPEPIVEDAGAALDWLRHRAKRGV